MCDAQAQQVAAARLATIAELTAEVQQLQRVVADQTREGHPGVTWEGCPGVDYAPGSGSDGGSEGEGIDGNCDEADDHRCTNPFEFGTVYYWTL